MVGFPLEAGKAFAGPGKGCSCVLDRWRVSCTIANFILLVENTVVVGWHNQIRIGSNHARQASILHWLHHRLAIHRLHHRLSIHWLTVHLVPPSYRQEIHVIMTRSVCELFAPTKNNIKIKSIFKIAILARVQNSQVLIVCAELYRSSATHCLTFPLHELSNFSEQFMDQLATLGE